MKRNPFLRVKLKSLAAEARIIRVEESRANNHGNYQLQEELHNHRVLILRSQARSTLLAYQYLRGKPYQICEKHPESVDWEAVTKMVKKYGGCELDELAWVGGSALQSAA